MASFGNYSNVIIGEKAVGMGGAFTGLTGDPAACSFYNPAALARMEGTSISASANLYHKFDTSFGDTKDFAGSATRINQGNFKSIPSASGNISAFGPFALGLSIIMPDYDFFSGSIQNSSTTKTYLGVLDESLWVGGSFALNLTEHHSLGLTVYYTSRYYQRTLTDELFRPSSNTAKVTSIEKTFTHNAVVYILGYFLRANENWSFGLSTRFPSIEVSGRGTVFRSTLDTAVGLTPQSEIRENVPSETRIPLKVSFGLGHSLPKQRTISATIDYYGAESYDDLEDATVATRVEHRPIVNGALGLEFYPKNYLRVRMGLFSNLSSHTPINNTDRLRADFVDMWGFSSNLGFFTSDKVSFSVGGFYTGGKGETVEQSGDSFRRIPKSKNIFSMMIGTSYFF